MSSSNEMFFSVLFSDSDEKKNQSKKCSFFSSFFFRVSSSQHKQHTRKSLFMLTFCPTCGNLLSIEKKKFKEEEEEFDDDDEKEDELLLHLCCKTCPYSYSIGGTFWSKTDVPIRNKKRVDDVLGGDDAWKNVDTTRSRCPKCSHDVAYFLMVQTRSADEPMTQFFRCVECANQWKEN